MKSNNFLWLVFVALVGLYFTNKYACSSKERSFNAELVSLDSLAVNEIVFRIKADEEIQIKKEGEDWIVSQAGKSVKAKTETISAILSQICHIHATGIVAKTPDKWASYEVSDSLGTKVKVYENSKLKESFIIGRFNFNQQNQAMTSFVRMEGDNEIYAVNSFLAVVFGRGFDAFRNQVLAEAPAAEITEIKFENKDTAYLISKNEMGQWLLDGQQDLDSAKVENYLQAFERLGSPDFEDNFDELSKEKNFIEKVILKIENRLEPLEISCYRDTVFKGPFVLESSDNEGTYFSSDSSGIMGKIFRQPEDFFIEKKKN